MPAAGPGRGARAPSALAWSPSGRRSGERRRGPPPECGPAIGWHSPEHRRCHEPGNVAILLATFDLDTGQPCGVTLAKTDRLYALVEELRVRAPRPVTRAELARRLE